MKAFNKVSDILETVLIAICGINILLIMLLVFVETLGRYLFRWTTPELESFNPLLMIIMILLSLGPILKVNEHVGVSVLKDLIKDKVKTAIYEIIMLIMVLVFCGFMGIAGIANEKALIISGMRNAQVGWLQMWTVELVIPIGIFFLTVFTLEQLIRKIIELKAAIRIKGSVNQERA